MRQLLPYGFVCTSSRRIRQLRQIELLLPGARRIHWFRSSRAHVMKLLEWLRRTLQTSSWTHEQAGLWATRHFPEQQRVATAVGEILVVWVGVTFESLTPGTRFIEDLAMDDLEPVTVVMALEEEFGLSIPDADSERLTTISELVCYLQERVHARPSAS